MEDRSATTIGQSTPYTPEELARLRSGPFGRLRAILDEAMVKKKAEIDGACPPMVEDTSSPYRRQCDS